MVIWILGMPWVVKHYRTMWSKKLGVMVEKAFPLLTAATLEAAVHGADNWAADKSKEGCLE